MYREHSIPVVTDKDDLFHSMVTRTHVNISKMPLNEHYTARVGYRYCISCRLIDLAQLRQ